MYMSSWRTVPTALPLHQLVILDSTTTLAVHPEHPFNQKEDGLHGSGSQRASGASYIDENKPER
jgi:hypothetical protein